LRFHSTDDKEFIVHDNVREDRSDQILAVLNLSPIRAI
jgi:hypothetical protein